MVADSLPRESSLGILAMSSLDADTGGPGDTNISSDCSVLFYFSIAAIEETKSFMKIPLYLSVV